MGAAVGETPLELQLRLPAPAPLVVERATLSTLAARGALVATVKGPRIRVEPWLAAYYRALRKRGEPLIYLLASYDEAVQIADGTLPLTLRKQARRLLTWQAEPKPNIDKA